MELGYLGVEVTDRSALDRFFAEVVGLIPGETAPGMSAWRNDDKVQRILVGDGPSDDATFFGIEHDAESFESAVARLTDSGVAVTPGSEAEIAARGVERMVHAPTPLGPRVELAQGLAQASSPFDSHVVPGGFNTAGVGFGHIVFQLSDQDRVEQAHEFVTKALGFHQSDWFDGTIGPMPVLARFYHCNSRHHTLAIAHVAAELPRALNHVMVETVNEENVGTAFDRAWQSDVEIDSSVGRHDNDRMFSFYAVTPAGFRLEFGYGAREITEPWTGNRRYDRPSLWGHQPLARP